MKNIKLNFQDHFSMREGISFFGFSKKINIKFHIDGISIKNLVSIRLSNVPERINFLAQGLVSLGKKFPSLLLMSGIFGALTKADDCLEQEPYRSNNIYLNQSNTSFLWIKYSLDYVLGNINNTCNFTLTNIRPGIYEKKGCLCSDINPDIGAGISRVILYGQNISSEALECIENFLSKNCDKFEIKNPIALWVAVGILGLLCCVGISLKINHHRRSRQENLLTQDSNTNAFFSRSRLQNQTPESPTTPSLLEPIEFRA